MREIQTEIMINAPIEKIWSTLIDFSSYPKWNPFIRRIEGTPEVHEQLTVTIEPPGKKSMNFHPKLISLSEYEFKWAGNLWLPGIFTGIHQFLLLPDSSTTVKFIHAERFSGIVHIPIFNLIQEATKAGFEKMNIALKNQCESPS